MVVMRYWCLIRTEFCWICDNRWYIRTGTYYRALSHWQVWRLRASGDLWQSWTKHLRIKRHNNPKTKHQKKKQQELSSRIRVFISTDSKCQSWHDRATKLETNDKSSVVPCSFKLPAEKSITPSNRQFGLVFTQRSVKQWAHLHNFRPVKFRETPRS